MAAGKPADTGIWSTTRLILHSSLFGRTYFRINVNYTYIKITKLPPYFVSMITTSVLISVMTVHWSAQTLRVHILYKYTEKNTGCPEYLNLIWRNCEERKRIRKRGSFIYTDRGGVLVYIKVSVCGFYFHMTIISMQNVLLFLVINFLWGIHFLTGFGEVFCLGFF